MRYNCYNYQTIGQRDIYRTPKLSTSSLDSVAITFNVAYQQYFGTDVPAPPNDSLRVLYSPDCGITWLPTGYAKGGATLSTVTGTTEASFAPAGAAQWRTERVVLKDICGKNLNNVMIGFEGYNDFGNNIYVDSINIVGFRSVNRNAIMQSISRPVPALCTNQYTPEITFGNAGLDTLRSLKINYRLDNGQVNTLNWTGELPKCGTVTLTLPTGTASVGTHILTVFTTEPNGSNDEVINNDTLKNTFAIFETAATPIIEGFENTVFPNPNWGVQNVTGGTTYARATNAARSGNGSMVINNPDSRNSNGAIDFFISPIVANSASFDSLHVDFDLAYRPGVRYPGSTVFQLDTLEIMATKDCGETFTSVWKSWGDQLQSLNDPNYAYNTPFIPKNSREWKKVRIYLSPFVGSDNFQLYFNMKGNRQNNLWMDNINISSTKLPQRLKDQGYLIYPNPFNNSFLIHHSAVEPPVDLQAVQIFNAAGQLVWDKRYNGNADRRININLNNKASGLYILKMIYTNKTVVERIVKN
jgi:hypothetical protein